MTDESSQSPTAHDGVRPGLIPVPASELVGISRWRRYAARQPSATGCRGAHVLASQPPLPSGPAWADEEWYQVRFRLACLNAVRPDALGAQITAAILRGWPVPRRLKGGGLTVTLRPGTGLSRRGVKAIKSKCYEPHAIYSVRLNRMDYVLYELARVMNVSELVHVIDAMCGTWRTNPVATVARIRSAAEEARNVFGKKNLLTALDLARDKVGSPQETWLRLLIVGAGLPTPLVCTPIQLPHAEHLYHPDLAYRGARIAIEYEGGHHRTDAWQWEHDIQRERTFRIAGWEYFRITKRTDIPEFLTDLTAALDERAPQWRRRSPDPGLSSSAPCSSSP